MFAFFIYIYEMLFVYGNERAEYGLICQTHVCMFLRADKQN